MENKVKSGTIVRLIVLLVTSMNLILVAIGKAPLELDEETMYVVGSGIAELVAALVAFWKNNSFTKAARKADQVLKAYKEDGYEDDDDYDWEEEYEDWDDDYIEDEEG